MPRKRLSFTQKPWTCRQYEVPGRGPAVSTQANGSDNLTEVHEAQNPPLLIPILKMKNALETLINKSE